MSTTKDASRGAVAGQVERQRRLYGADISPCGRYRYALWRKWGAGGTCVFVWLNPSTADATFDDQTINQGPLWRVRLVWAA
jgi:hypothetical protein